MYTHSRIIECLRGLIGFEQSYNADVASIDTDLQTSASGLFVAGLHPLLNYENILACAEQFEKTNVRAWSGAINYTIGAIVKSGVTIYRAIKAGLNNVVTDTDYWQPTTLLSAYLRRVYDSSSNKLIQRVFTEKKLNEVAKSLLSSVTLFEGVGNMSGRIIKNNRLVGFKIKLLHADTAANLGNIGLQLDTPQNPVKIYLYHSLSNEPLQTFELNHTKSLTFQWHDAVSVLNNTAGHYYIVYKESELTGSAVKKEYNFSGKGYCGSCSEGIANARLYNQWGKFISIQPFYVNSYTGTDLWDEDKEIYDENINWGLNLKMAIQCDVSDILCTNKNVLTNALAQQLTVDLLQEMTFSLRDNQRMGKITGLAAAALDNQENGQYGEVKKLAQAIKSVSFDFSGLSDACLPCNQNGWTLSSAWR